MKKILLSVIAGAVAISAFAQNMEVKETSYEFNNSNRPALSIDIPMVSSKTVEKEWKHFMKEYKPESFKNKKVMFADNVLVPGVSSNTVDIYAKTEEQKDVTTLFVTVDMGGAYLSAEHGEKLVTMKSMIKNFAVGIVKDIYKEKIEDQEKIVGSLTKDVEKATNNKESLEKDIKSYEEKIEDNKQEIKELNKTIEEKSAELEKEQKVLDNIKGEVQKIQ